MNGLNHLFRWIETRDAILTFLSLALIAQVPQVAELVLHIVGKQDWLSYLHAYMFAIALDGAILIFVTRQRTGLAWVFAIGSMLMNMGHYVPPVLLRHPAPLAPQALVDIAAAILLSIALPFALAQYSHVAADDTHGSEVETTSRPTSAPQLPTSDPSPDAHDPLLSESDASDTPPRPRCAYEGCPNEASVCEHGCGVWVCATHKGNHNQWRCTHNSKSRAFQEAPEAL
jgi:hypothetical protein